MGDQIITLYPIQMYNYHELITTLKKIIILLKAISALIVGSASWSLHRMPIKMTTGQDSVEEVLKFRTPQGPVPGFVAWVTPQCSQICGFFWLTSIDLVLLNIQASDFFSP